MKLVSDHLRSLNIEKSPKDCRTKWHNLVKSYRLLKFTKRDPGKHIRFHYFVEMDEVLGSTKIPPRKKYEEIQNEDDDVIEIEDNSNEANRKRFRTDVDHEEVPENAPTDDKMTEEINYKEEYYKKKIEEIDKKKDFREKILKIEMEKLELERAKLRLATEKFLYKRQCRDASINLQF